MTDPTTVAATAEAIDLRAELLAYLDTLAITGDNIGEVRRSLFVPWDSAWNGWVRDETASREGTQRAMSMAVFSKIEDGKVVSEELVDVGKVVKGHPRCVFGQPTFRIVEVKLSRYPSLVLEIPMQSPDALGDVRWQRVDMDRAHRALVDYIIGPKAPATPVAPDVEIHDDEVAPTLEPPKFHVCFDSLTALKAFDPVHGEMVAILRELSAAFDEDLNYIGVIDAELVRSARAVLARLRDEAQDRGVARS